MSFSSMIFILQFLPAALILYYIFPKKAKNYLLVFLSLVFCALCDLMLVPVVVAVTLTNYFCALGIEKFENKKHLRRLMLAISVIVTLGLLFTFRYLDFFSQTINSVLSLNIPMLGFVIPLGISFFSLHALSYTLDVYRGNAYAERSFIDIALYMSFFPQLFPGTVMHYRDMDPDLRKRVLDADDLDSGITDFIIGLARKVIIADNLAPLWKEINELGIVTISTGLAWISVIVFGLQIYFEFSGYAQMAIGVARLFGFKLPKNFDNPFSAGSIIDFCRRWNISLRRWFKEYLYIPLGGSRKKFTFTALNLLLVWLLAGLWHGASWNFVLLGLYFFMFIMIERLGLLGFLNKHKILSRFYVIFVLIAGFAIFSSPDLINLRILLGKMFVPTFIEGNATVTAWYYLRNYAVTIVVACFFSTSLASKLYAWIDKRRIWRNIVLIVIFVLSIVYLIDPAQL